MLATAEADVREDTGAPFEVEPQQQDEQAVARIEYPVAMSVVSELQKKYSGLTISGIDDKAGMKAVDEARREVKALKVRVENRRVELKAGALEYGRKVDAAAKKISEPLEALEKQLAGKQKAVTDEADRLKREAEDKARQEKQAKLKARMDALQAVRAYLTPAEVEAMDDAYFATLLEQKQTDEFNRIESEKAEQTRRDEEAERQREHQRQLDEQSEKLRLQQEELDRREQAQADRDAKARHTVAVARLQTLATANCRPAEFEIDGLSDEAFATYLAAATQRNSERIERDRKEAEEKKQREETEARQKTERERLEADEKKQREEAARVRAEQLKPDRDKLAAFADELEAMSGRVPEVSPASAFARQLVINAVKAAAVSVREIAETGVK